VPYRGEMFRGLPHPNAEFWNPKVADPRSVFNARQPARSYLLRNLRRTELILAGTARKLKVDRDPSSPPSTKKELEACDGNPERLC